MFLDTPMALSFSWDDRTCCTDECEVECGHIADRYIEFVDAVDTLTARLPTDVLLVGYAPTNPVPVGALRWSVGFPDLEQLFALKPGTWTRFTATGCPAGHTTAAHPAGHPNVPVLRLDVDGRVVDLLVLTGDRQQLCTHWGLTRYPGRLVADLSPTCARMLWTLIRHHAKHAGPSVNGTRSLAALSADRALAAVAAVGLLDADPTVQVATTHIAATADKQPLRTIADAAHATTLTTAPATRQPR